MTGHKRFWRNIRGVYNVSIEETYMKRALISIVFLCVAFSAFALPVYNPFNGEWLVELEGNETKMVFHQDGTIEDSDGTIHKYDYDGEYLYLDIYSGVSGELIVSLKLEVEFFEYNQFWDAYDKESGFEIHARKSL